MPRCESSSVSLLLTECSRKKECSPGYVIAESVHMMYGSACGLMHFHAKGYQSVKSPVLTDTQQQQGFAQSYLELIKNEATKSARQKYGKCINNTVFNAASWQGVVPTWS